MHALSFTRLPPPAARLIRPAPTLRVARAPARPARRAAAASAPTPAAPAPAQPPRFDARTILPRADSAKLLPRAAAALALGVALAAAAPAGAALAKAACCKGAAAAAPGVDVAGAAETLLSFVLHLDKHLGAIIARHGAATYAILFAIVFAETGFVLTPFLPGDSLLFACGTFASLGSLALGPLLAVFGTAAILGDAVNYAAGKHLGAAAVARGLVKKEFVQKTEAFYAKHGPRTVVLARFVPIVRTFAPFVAGVAAMPWTTFSVYNAAGAALWVGSLTLAGAAFGTLPAVRDNFSAVVLGIVAVSVLPLAVEWVQARAAKGKEA